MRERASSGESFFSRSVPRYSRLITLAAVGFLLAVGMAQAVQAAPDVESLSGAGASFPYPVYSKWAVKYSQMTGMKLDYQSVGSGAGIAQIKAKTVDFGASDEPLKAAELDKEGLLQFPMIMGGVVPVFNLPGVRKGQLKLTPDILAEIYLGQIRKWNDRKIMAVNPDAKLPDQEITVVHRADGSGTTWIFTSYLSKISSEWKEKVGSGKTVSWPTGVGGKGNEGVAALVKKTEGTIGYVEFAYALKERLKHVQLQNRAGKFLSPTIETFQRAAANADWASAAGFYISLTDQPGERSWPVVGASYILVHKNQAVPEKARAVLKFFDWCYKNGSSMATELHYVSVPQNVYALVEATWKKEVSSGGQPVWQ